MLYALTRSVGSEWLKQKRSFTFRVVLGSAGFVPAIMFLARFRRLDALPAVYRTPRFWEELWVQAWESMALMILPMAIMLIVSLMTQLEDRNNAWKQLFATPQRPAVIFAAKLIVVLFLVAELIVLFDVAVYLSGLLPAVLLPAVPRPVETLPAGRLLARSLAFYVDALPIVGMQYLLALRFRTFLTPLGIGMAIWILSIGTISWQFRYLVPYSYPIVDYLTVEYHRQLSMPGDVHVIALGVFFVSIVTGFVLFSRRQDKG